MNMWNCCRTCLKESRLLDIFRIREQHHEYSELLMKCTGLEIKLNDSLPQQICEECIMKINYFTEFRINCYQAHKTLIDKMKMKLNKKSNVKDIRKYTHSPCYSSESYNDITDLTVDESINKIYDNEQMYVEFEMPVHDIINKRCEIIFQDSIKYNKVDLVYKDIKLKAEKKQQHSNTEIVCKYCYEKFNDKISMYNHYKTHTGKTVICEHCGTKFSTKKRLLIHCRAKHGYEKIDKCTFCEYTASNAESVKIHERTHTGEKPYVCAQCGAAFHRRSCYLQHLPIHLSRKTVQCDECPSMFKSVTLMKIHKARHKKRKKIC